MPTENNENPNFSESSNPLECEKTPEQKGMIPSKCPESETTQTDLEWVNPSTLVSRQPLREMTGNKIKTLMKKMKEHQFNPEKPIEVADVQGRLIILDGHHRTVAARRLRLAKVPIRKKQVSLLQEQQLLQEVAEASKNQLL